MKDYLVAENERNHKNHKVYEELLRRATGAHTVVIGHHVSFQLDGSDDLNEIPSADTVIFCVELMTRAFGSAAKAIMLTLSTCSTEERDARLASYLEEYPHAQEKGAVTA
jgi:hypothetical protein